MKVLIAGGAGYIGSTIASACIDAGHQPVVLDNLVTGRAEFVRDRTFYQGDIADGALLDQVFAEHPDIEVVVLAAALIVVPDSVSDPLRYYRENVGKAISFVEHLVRHSAARLIFSSSASIYAAGDSLEVDEEAPLLPLSPYARSKAIVESVLSDVAAAGRLRSISLRYFNPVGADPRLRTGLQLPRPSHALGQVIESHREGRAFTVTGTDYDTRDGSGIRDYVHVWDLAQAHLAAIERFDAVTDGDRASVAINLGTGRGTTVLELVEAFERVTGSSLAVEPAPRRAGDSAGAYTTSSRAEELLGWSTRLTLEEGIADSLRWADRRPSVLGA